MRAVYWFKYGCCLMLALTALALSSCHVHGHIPPGQVKQALDPNPGHGGTPPGQR